MQLKSKRAARLPRTAPGIATSPKAAAALDDVKHSVASTSRQAVLDRAARYVEAACADLAAMIAEDQGAAFVDEIAALSAIVAVLRMADRSLVPGEAAYIVNRTPETVIAWCRKFGVGVKLGGQWIVDPLRLAVLLLGAAP